MLTDFWKQHPLFVIVWKIIPNKQRLRENTPWKKFKNPLFTFFSIPKILHSSLNCNILPDNATAQKVPLPSGVDAGFILQTRGSNPTNLPDWSTSKPTSGLTNKSTKLSTNGQGNQPTAKGSDFQPSGYLCLVYVFFIAIMKLLN